MSKIRSKFSALILILAFTLLIGVPAGAWKPTTHIYLAELARLDAIDDGKVSIYRVNFVTGQMLDKIGDYAVDPDILAAIRLYPAQFRAGVVGPDAYPDILTGQEVIHPDHSLGNFATPSVPGGSNAWLEYLWGRCFSSPKGPTVVGGSPQEKAFVAGFLSHSAGDMYAHTFVNHISGGDFTYGNNAVKHILLEAYIGEHTPPAASYEISLSGVDDFIYRNMIDARPGSVLDKSLLVGDGSQFSIPRIFSTLKTGLQKKIEDYNNKSPFDRGLYDASHLGWIAYQKSWIKDIDSGLRAWPSCSHEVARALITKPGGSDFSAAQNILKLYVRDHLLSMMGLPDFVGGAIANIQLINKWILEVLDDVLPNVIKAPFKELKREIAVLQKDLLNFILVKYIGRTYDQIKGYVSQPQTYFDAVIGPGSQPGNPAVGERIDRHTFDVRELHIDDSQGAVFKAKGPVPFDYTKFAPAYNTVTMTKLLLMRHDEINRLLRDLGSTTSMTKPNVMLGFDTKLDSSNQWTIHPEKMVFVQAGVYEQIFMKIGRAHV